jgi:hypothetical protein
MLVSRAMCALRDRAREPTSSATAGTAAAGALGRELCEALLAFESRLEVLEHGFAADRILFWPLCRWRVFDHTLQSALGEDRRRARPRAGPGKRLRYLGAALRRDPARVRGRFDALFFGSTVGVSVQREGKWFGRINDHFALEHGPRALVIDWSHDSGFREPRYPERVAFQDAINLRAGLRARLSPGPSSAQRRAIDRFVRFLSERLPVAPDPELVASLTRSLSSQATRLRFLRGEYQRLFDNMAPRLLFLEDASFGTQSFILKWAHERGIASAELQHGIIVPGVLAYSYARELCESAEYRPYLPEALLTYGRFFSDNTRTASRVIEVGHPHFEAKRAELERTPRRAHAGRSLLIISQADSASELVPLALAVRAALPPQDELVYRLHPSEAAVDALYAPLERQPGLRISRHEDVYELLHDADAVVGVSSTTLFEAAGLGRPVFVYATPGADFYVPRSFGAWFQSAEELLAQLAGPAPAAPELLFQPDWRAHYRRFLAEHGLAAI